MINTTTLKIGDIIAFRDVENTVTTHRIIDIVENNGKTQFITKGDNNSTQDRNLVNLNDVEGIYIARISGFGSIMNSLAQPTTIMALALLITVIFVIGFMISMQKDKKLEREEFLKYKMMKEYEEKKQQEEELLEQRRAKEKSRRSYSEDDILEILRAREERGKNNDDDYRNRY